jgi:hypothetical protein
LAAAHLEWFLGARHVHTGKRLALKEFAGQETDQDIKMIQREIAMLIGLNHVSTTNHYSCLSFPDQL